MRVPTAWTAPGEACATSNGQPLTSAGHRSGIRESFPQNSHEFRYFLYGTIFVTAVALGKEFLVGGPEVRWSADASGRSFCHASLSFRNWMDLREKRKSAFFLQGVWSPRQERRR